ncbi:MAG TPA: terminase family protein [Solirubrobacterales bacterium]
MSDGERLQLKELLEGYQALRRLNPLTFYMPHPGQAEFHSKIHEAPCRAFMGGNRAGKTTAGLIDNLIQAAPVELLPDHLKPYKRFRCPFYCRIVIPDLKRHLNDVLIPKLREWTPKMMLRNGNFDASYHKADYQIRFQCGCRFDVMSFEQELDKFGGAALHRCHYDEEPPEDIREECLMRLIDFDGDEVFTMTPTRGMSWMYDGILEASNTDPEIHVQVVDMDDNPHLSERGKRRAIKGLSDEKIEARKKGRMVHFEGMVYPAFEESRVAVPDRGLVGSLEVVVGIDPGVRTCGVSFMGFDRDNNCIVFDELRLHDQAVPGVCVSIRDKLEHWGLPESGCRFVIDPAARQRTLTTATTVETAFHNERLYTEHGQADREGGIDIIEARLSTGALQISRDCTDHFWEAARYRRKFHEESGIWTVVKLHDHVMDALRYGVTSRPWAVEKKEVSRIEQRMNAYRRDPDAAFPPKAVGYRRPGSQPVVV